MVLIAQATALIFTVALGITLITSMRKDGKLTADEASKVVLMGLLVYMTVVNGVRTSEWLVFDQGTYLIVLASVLALAGIDIYKTSKLFGENSDKPKDTKPKE